MNTTPDDVSVYTRSTGCKTGYVLTPPPRPPGPLELLDDPSPPPDGEEDELDIGFPIAKYEKLSAVNRHTPPVTVHVAITIYCQPRVSDR